MKLLAFDLSYTGPSGWVLWDTQADDPVVDYGEIEPKVNGSGDKEVQVIFDLNRQINGLLKKFMTAHLLTNVAYEFTDWHRTLAGLHKTKLLSEYAIERNAQRTLGRAEAALIIACMNQQIIPYRIGANEAKKEFGAMRKDACAHLFAEEYPRFRFIDTAGDDAKYYLVDTKLMKQVSHHISDSFVIGSVVGRRLELNARLDHH